MSLRPVNRREFLAASGVVAAACALNPSAASAASASSTSSQHRLDLNGGWQVAKTGSDEWISVTVPGCIHTDLLAAGKIPDPFFRDNERAVQWVGETDWVYRRPFNVPAGMLEGDRVLLRCEGLDTLAVVKLNGREVGRADNMFRLWEFDAKPVLKPGDNIIEISFASPLPYMKQRQAARKLFEWAGPHEPHGRAWVRKEPCNFGWDWGPVLITCGIWRDISLVEFDTARLQDIVIFQDHPASGKVRLRVEVKAETTRGTPLKANLTVNLNGQSVARARARICRTVRRRRASIFPHRNSGGRRGWAANRFTKWGLNSRTVRERCWIVQRGGLVCAR
jgi:beta-mannosidase